nr:putative retrotransposon Orf1 [Ipomoea batatas]
MDGFENIRPCSDGRKSDARVRPASVRTRCRSKTRIADASGRIRPDFAPYLPNDEENWTPASDATAVPEKKKEIADALRTRVRCASDGQILGDSADETKMPPKSTASKSRRKECAKKRKHDVGSSSRAAEGESDLLIPGGRSLRHLSGVQIARVEELRAKGASGGYYFDLSMLDAYGCREEVERMMSRRSWEHLFSWRDDTYEPVVHEFIATYTAISSNHMWTPCMKFTLFGREHQVSLIQLGEILGFYTPEDSRTEEWRNLPTDFDSDAAAEAYWYEITNGRGGRFTGTKPNTSKVVRSPLLMMKLLLNLTFGGRNKNLHKIYRFDLFNLWSLEMNEPIQMACMVQQLFTSQTKPKCPYVWIGPVVTRLCHGLGLQAELAREKSIASMQPFTDAHLSRSYAPRIGAAPRPQRGEQPQEQEPVVQGGPNVPPEYAEYPPVYDWASMRAFQLQLHNQSMNAFNQRMDLHHEELMRQNEAIARQNEAYVRQEERQEQQSLAIEQLRLWMEQRFPPPSQGNLFSSPLSSMFGSPPPSPKGLPRAEMMVPRHTLERGEPSRRPNEDTSSEEGEAPIMEVAHRGLMIEVEDLFRYRHFRDKQIIEWNYLEAPVLAVLGIQGEFERMTSQPFWSHICSWRDATYVPIVREFISTLEVNERVHNRRQPSIRFKLFHRQYNISSDELGNLLGFYTLHDQDQGWYANFVDDFPNEHQPELFWWSIARQGDALAYEAVATTMTPLDIGDFLQFGIAPEGPSEDEDRGEQRDLWGIIERLENRVNMLEHKVRRLKLEQFGEESDGSGI